MNYWDEVAQQLMPELLGLFEDWYGSGVSLKRRLLCQELDCSDSVLRSAISYLRRRGHLVISDPDEGGYRLARSVEEAEEYIEKLREQADALYEVVTAMEETLASRQPEQHSFFEQD